MPNFIFSEYFANANVPIREKHTSVGLATLVCRGIIC